MRPVLHGDVTAAARALLRIPEPGRVGLCRRMIREAAFAYRYMMRSGKPHPLWGTGSLMSAALLRPVAPEPNLDDIAYCTCLEMVLRELIAYRTGHPSACRVKPKSLERDTP